MGVGLQESIWPEDASLCIHGPSAWPDEPFPEPRSEWDKPDEDKVRKSYGLEVRSLPLILSCLQGREGVLAFSHS